MHHPNRVGHPLEPDGPPIELPDALDPPGEMDDLLAGEDLAGAGPRAEPGREVQRATSIAALDLHRFTGVESDPDREWHGRGGDGLLHEPSLQFHRRADRLPRGREHAERFVASELEEHAVATLDALASDPCEPRRELAGGLIAPLLREEGVPPDVSDQERADMDVVAHATPGLPTSQARRHHDPGSLSLIALRRGTWPGASKRSGKRRADPLRSAAHGVLRFAGLVSDEGEP